MKLKLLNQKGFAHWVMPVVVIGVIAATGGYIYLNQSHADSINSVKFGANAWNLQAYSSLAYSNTTNGYVVKMNKLLVQNNHAYESQIIIQNDGKSSFTKLDNFIRAHYSTTVKLCTNGRSVTGAPYKAGIFVWGIAAAEGNVSYVDYADTYSTTGYSTRCHTFVTKTRQAYLAANNTPKIFIQNADEGGPLYINWMTLTAQ